MNNSLKFNVNLLLLNHKLRENNLITFYDLPWVIASFSCAVVGSFVIGSKVLGSPDDKNGLEDEESESLPTGFKTVYKIFENFQIKSSLGCWS